MCILQVILAPQLMGGVFDWCVPVIAAGALCCLLLSLIPQASREITPPKVLWVGVIALAWTALQLVPHGVGLSSVTVPERATPLRLLGLALGSTPTSATAITVDFAATQMEVLKGCALLCVFTACYLVARRGRGAELLMAVSASGALMALVALSHRAVGARSVFGLYRWQVVEPALPAPILNPNCLAGFLVLTAPVALGAAISTADPRIRLVQYISAFVIAGTGLLTGSRAGTGAMIFALSAMVLVARARARAGEDRRGRTAVAALIMSAALAIAVVVGAEPLLKALSSDDLSKLELVRDGFKLALQHPWFGVGRGGFSAAMAARMDDGGRFVHAENLVATWLSEWGIPIGLCLVVSVGQSVLRLLTKGSQLRLGAGIGLLAFGAQNLLDLGAELVGIATVAAACLGAGLGQLSTPEPEGKLRFGHLGWGLITTTTAALLWISPHAFANGDQSFERRLEELKSRGSRAEFRAELGRALAAHPFEPVLYFAAAQECIEHRDLSAVRWLNLTMATAPLWSAPHSEAARLLLALGRSHQAALEAREAARLRPVAGAWAACAIARATTRIDHLMLAAEGVPNMEARRSFFDVAARCLSGTATARPLDQHLLRLSTTDSGPVLREHQRLVEENKHAEAGLLLAKAASARDADPKLVLANARWLLGAARAGEAEVELRRAASLGANEEFVASLAAEIAAARGDAAAMRAGIERLRALGAGTAKKLATAALLRGRLEAGLGNFPEAEAAFDDAVTIDRGPDTLRPALAFARSHGNLAKAARLKGQLCSLMRESSECRAERR